MVKGPGEEPRLLILRPYHRELMLGRPCTISPESRGSVKVASGGVASHGGNSLFGEAKLVFAGIIPLFDRGGEEK
jgi:hypothetical protein